MKFPSVKSVYDWATNLFQLKLVDLVNIRTLNGQSLLGNTDLSMTDEQIDEVFLTAITF